eukprot:COSAG02_NODE_9726_length_2130_cov_9.353520_1_plen_437_part_00
MLSAEQHSTLSAAREQIQEDLVGGVQAYAHLAQSALAVGELDAASRVLAEGLAVIDAAGPDAEFLAGSLLMVQASVHKCNGNTSLALEAFDQMSRLLPTALGPDPDRQESVRSLFRLDLLRILMHETAELPNDGAHKESQLSALSRRHKREAESVLRGGPWTSLAQLPRDYQSGLRARAWWNLEEEGVLQAADSPARLLDTLRTAQQGLVKEYHTLLRAGKIVPERECIHGRPAAGFGEWMQYDFLGGAAAARHKTTSSTAVLLSRPKCERGVAPAGCAAASAVETVLREGGWGTGGVNREPLVLRAGYSAVEPGAWIRPHFGESNAQLKLHFGLTVPVDSAGEPCALLRVGSSVDKAVGDHDPIHGGGWKGWHEGGLLLFDDSFEHEVRVQRAKDATQLSTHHDGDDANVSHGQCAETRVVLQLVLRHPDLWLDD